MDSASDVTGIRGFRPPMLAIRLNVHHLHLLSTAFGANDRHTAREPTTACTEGSRAKRFVIMGRDVLGARLPRARDAPGHETPCLTWSFCLPREYAPSQRLVAVCVL